MFDPKFEKIWDVWYEIRKSVRCLILNSENLSDGTAFFYIFQKSKCRVLRNLSERTIQKISSIILCWRRSFSVLLCFSKETNMCRLLGIFSGKMVENRTSLPSKNFLLRCAYISISENMISSCLCILSFSWVDWKSVTG